MNSVNEFGGVVSSGGSFQVGINFSKESLGPPPPQLKGFLFHLGFFGGFCLCWFLDVIFPQPKNLRYLSFGPFF